jgi:ABC-type nitrate/sulfonate/bicarbonate transport system substrate-binding protein
MNMCSRNTGWFAAAVFFLTALDQVQAGEAEKVSFALPAVPPVFGGVVALVAKEEGFFKKRGLDVDVRAFDSGAAAAQAVVAGNIDMSLSPTPVVVRMISNANVPLVAIYGLEHPDWLLASTDLKLNKCEDLKGQAVGVDSIGGARAVALSQFIRPCGLKVEDVKLVALSSNVGAAMIAGQLKFGVLHLDDVPVLDEQLKRPVTVISDFKKVNPLSHYLAVVCTTDRLKQKRDTYVRVVAGLIDATNFMLNPKNADRVAQIATATGRTASLAKDAMARLLKIDFWPVGHDGLTKANLDSVIAVEKEIGGIKAGKEPVGYERLVDRTVWKDANALVKR